MTTSDPTNKAPLLSGIPAWIPLLAFILITFLIGVAGYATFEQYKKSITEREIQNLGAIADLKVAQIVDWRKAHKRRAEFFLHGAMLPDEVDQWFREGAPANERRQKILKVFDSLQREQGYKTVTLLDREGAARLSTNGAYAASAAEEKLAMEAMRGQHVLFTDLHRGSHEGDGIHIDCVAPLMSVDKKKGAHIVGALLLEIDPDLFLYPLIRSWPTPSPSAETLLVRRDGDEVLFLNEVRHKKGAALSLRIPLASTQTPAALAVFGQAKVMEGVDYRGVPVIAALRGVPGTPWFMVAKIDKAEFFASIDALQRWATGLAFAFIACGGVLVFLWFNSHQARHDAAIEREMLIRRLQKSEALLKKSQQMARIGSWELDLRNGALFWSDEIFRIFEIDPALFNASYEAFLNTVHPDDRTMVDKAYTDSLKNRTPYIIAHRLIFPDQRVKFVQEWCETQYDREGRPVRSIGTAQDITEYKEAEKKLETSYQELEKITTHLEAVREDEQKRIARELHDEMGGVLAALDINVSLLATQPPVEKADIRAKLDNLAKLVAAGIHAMRRAVSELRPDLLDEAGIKFAVEKYVREFQASTGIECDLRLPEEELTLDGNRSTAIFRIIQESLTNVAKHAKASRVSIVLSAWDDSLVLTVKDNGEGFSPNARKAKTFGLLGIRERAAMVGGKARITGVAGKGTTVRVSIPQRESDPAADSPI